METRPVLVTGSTGYIGGRLVPRLLAAGYRVRAAARSLDKLEGRTWAGHPNLELVQADLLDPFSTAGAVKGCFAAYYLVHSMNSRHHDFVEGSTGRPPVISSTRSGDPVWSESFIWAVWARIRPN